MQVGALVTCVLSVALSAVLLKLDSWLLGGVLLWFGFHKSFQVFAPPAPPFERW